VIDEIQMLGDAGRGWAWTRALLGLPVQQLHVCGDPGVLPVLQQLAADCGDELQVCVCCTSHEFCCWFVPSQDCYLRNAYGITHAQPCLLICVQLHLMVGCLIK
jgi:hypothetical protein